MRIGQTSLLYFVARFTGSVLGFLSTVYFARVLGAEVLGYFALTITIVTWVALAGEVGLSKAITKRISEGNDPSEHVGAGLLITGALFVATGLALVPLQGLVNTYVGESVTEFVFVLVGVTLFTSLVSAILEGDHLVHVSGVLSVSKQAGQSLLQIILVVAGFELGGMLVGYALGAFVVGLAGLRYLNIRPSIPERTHFVSLFDFAKFSWVGNLRSKTFDTVDIAILGLFTSAGLIGIYSVAWNIAMFLKLFGSAISTTVFPEISKVSSEGDLETASTLTEDALSYAGLFLIPGLAGSYLIGDRLLLVYESEFVKGHLILVLLIAALLIYTYNNQLLNTLNAIDRPDLAFRANAAFIGCNLALNIVLIYTYEWVGAAIATVIAAGIGFALSIRYVYALLDVTFPYGEVARQWLAALGMSAVVVTSRTVGETRWIADHNELFVIVLVGIGSAAYLTLLFVISRPFRTVVQNNLPVDWPIVERP